MVQEIRSACMIGSREDGEGYYLGIRIEQMINILFRFQSYLF
ncbi:hypothetical protein [Coxiella burnetii]|uniref:Uncharacterized protein n=2 Tax=Coxiella burnetii TaxID=777 RepID=B5QSE8_COXBU|nr:hypothetical protein [Coxiella burnetii]YP_002333021.1 hypothetical protein CBU_1692a [Coxiella burnetii RSA 493]ACI15312.1 hypothetical protein CBU_1692a [Coxiella burnetii RSA 493]ACI23084.1 hypothetical protein CBUD_0309a [Coxiella burnetii Dugway 5J108-111]ACJ19625.1 hypothetical protein CbuK_0318 [Coxiella burnetii CbuK_Q154]AML48406.1 hypothetical protein AUR58_03850 [Coxiella burnetii]AML54413.1 hypothetical protein AYM38_03410 [Coxiella burnetii]